jgi:dolichol-phosphate mannosyltransferase
MPKGVKPAAAHRRAWCSRYLRFNLVGMSGFAVQLATLALLVHGARMWYVIATVLAVEAAVLHNFVLHERWTWRDRRLRGRVFDRLVRFHGANGLTSVAAHIVGTPLLVEAAGFQPLGANVLLVVLMSVVNYQLGDRVVFAGGRAARRRTRPAGDRIVSVDTVPATPQLNRTSQG